MVLESAAMWGVAPEPRLEDVILREDFRHVVGDLCGTSLQQLALAARSFRDVACATSAVRFKRYVPGGAVAEVLGKFPRLRHVSLRGCSQVTESAVFAVASCLDGTRVAFRHTRISRSN